MAVTGFIVVLVSIACLSTTLHGCSVANWVKRSMQWRLYRSEIVVYGKDIGRVQVGDEKLGMNRTDMLFRVYCVIKGDANKISETITVEGVYPRLTCLGVDEGPGKGPDVHPNETAVVALKRLESGNYYYDIVNAIQRVAFQPTNDTFKKAYEVCGLQNPMPPHDRLPNATYPTCPNMTIPSQCTNGSLKPTCTHFLLLLLACMFKFMNV